MKRKVLLSGGFGFLGASLIRQLLLTGGYQIVAVRQPFDKTWRLDDRLHRIEVIDLDCLDLNACEAVMSSVQPDIVINLSGLILKKRRRSPVGKHD